MAQSPPAFICDSMLGRLAKILRMLGFDTLYAGNDSTKTPGDTAVQQQRILLTRRTAFLKAKPERSGQYIFIRSNSAVEQVREVMAACALHKTNMRPFTVCLHCNARLAPVPREEALGRVPEYVAATVDNFTACPQCRKVYWKGTHYGRMLRELEKIMGPRGAAVSPSQ